MREKIINKWRNYEEGHEDCDVDSSNPHEERVEDAFPSWGKACMRPLEKDHDDDQELEQFCNCFW